MCIFNCIFFHFQIIFLLKIKLEYNIQSYNFSEIIRPILINLTTLIIYTF
jgi:hypothetical protein